MSAHALDMYTLQLPKSCIIELNDLGTIRQFDHQRRLFPDDVHVLIDPTGTFGADLNVKVVEQLGQDKSRF